MCYVPPETTITAQLDGRSAQLRFHALTERLLVATAQGHALLAADFNARVGSLSEPWVTDVGGSIPPQLQITNSTTNAHGRKLVQLCADSAMILCTGRTLANTPAQPTFKARTNMMASCLDHILVDPDLFSSIEHCGVGPTKPDSEHMPLEMRILLSAAAPPSSPPPPEQQHTPTWIWDGAKQEQYALALQAGPCQASLQQSSAAAAAGDLQQADDDFSTALKAAAEMAGLRQTRPQSSPPSCQSFLGLIQGVLCSGLSYGMPSCFLHTVQRSEFCSAGIGGSSGAARQPAISETACLCLGHLKAILASFGAKSACCTACSIQRYRHLQLGTGTLPI